MMRHSEPKLDRLELCGQVTVVQGPGCFTQRSVGALLVGPAEAAQRSTPSSSNCCQQAAHCR